MLARPTANVGIRYRVRTYIFVNETTELNDGAGHVRVKDRSNVTLDPYAQFYPYTMVPPDQFAANLALAELVRDIPGVIVECGVWKAGMSAGIATLLGTDREYWLFDSFEGLPPAGPEDGATAPIWQKRRDCDQCRASEDEARATMAMAGIEPHIVKGWFADTIWRAVFPDGIALLRLDGDWYESTLQALMHLFPQVNPGGVIIIDDYGWWEGCAKAVHDYMSANSRPERIETVTDAAQWQVPTTAIAFIRKDHDPQMTFWRSQEKHRRARI